MKTTKKKTSGVKEGFVGQRLMVLPPNIKKTLTNNPLIKPFYLTAIGHYPKAVNHEIERKSGSNQYILIYCTDGGGYIRVNNREFHLRPNSYFIIPKHIAHSYQSDKENPWSIYWVHFSGDIATDVFQRSLSEDNTPTVNTIPYEQNRIDLFEQVYAILEHSFKEKEMELVSFNLLHFITSLIYHKEANPAIYNNDTTSQSIAFMKKNMNKKFEVHTFATQQSISVAHYCRIFKKKTGYSPINYFNQLKIQKSCQYLYFTDRSIKDICVELGFDDQYYFSRLFRKTIGVSPSNYKKQHKK